MAKQKAEAPKEEKSIREVVKGIVQNIGTDANFEAVSEELRRQKVDFSESTVKQYVSAARVELGFSSPRGSGGKKATPTTNTDEPTLSDLLAAKKLATELKTEPAKLLELVKKLKTVGDLDKVESCLQALLTLGYHNVL